MQPSAISNYGKEKFVLKQNFPSVNLNIDTSKNRHLQAVRFMSKFVRCVKNYVLSEMDIKMKCSCW